METSHRHKWKKIMLAHENTPFAEGSYIWWCKKCKVWVFIKERPSALFKVNEERQKPEITEEWIEEKAQEVMFLVDDVNTAWSRKVLNVRDFIRSLVEGCVA